MYDLVLKSRPFSCVGSCRPSPLQRVDKMKHGSSLEAVLAVYEPCLEVDAFISSMVLHLRDC